jgi:hypothetical protein
MNFIIVSVKILNHMNLKELFDRAKSDSTECGIMKAQELQFRIKGITETKFHFGKDEDGHYIAIPVNKEVYLPEKVGNLVLVIDCDENISYYVDQRDLHK